MFILAVKQLPIEYLIGGVLVAMGLLFCIIPAKDLIRFNSFGQKDCNQSHLADEIGQKLIGAILLIIGVIVIYNA